MSEREVTMSDVKLSPAQRRLLRYIAQLEGGYVWTFYGPEHRTARALLRRGLLARGIDNGWTITPAGREAVAHA